MNNEEINKSPYLLVVGKAQDGGFPHTGCINKCCKEQWEKLKKGNSEEEAKPSLGPLMSWPEIIFPSISALRPHFSVA